MLTLKDLITKAQTIAFDHPELLNKVVQVTIDGESFDARRVVIDDDNEAGEPECVFITAS